MEELLLMMKLLKFPKAAAGSFMCGSLTRPTVKWHKRGGHAGSKVVDRVITAAKELGWSNEFNQSHSQTDVVSNDSDLHSPDGKFKLSGSCRYGNQATDNSYILELSTVKLVKVSDIMLQFNSLSIDKKKELLITAFNSMSDEDAKAIFYQIGDERFNISYYE